MHRVGLTRSDTIHLLLQLASMLAVAVCFGQAARRLRMPVVFGELLGGIVLGPTVFGAAWPDAFGLLFPGTGPTAVVREALARLGLLCFLLAAGLELRLSDVRRQGSGVVSTSLLGIAFPFGLGYALVVAFPGLWAAHSTLSPSMLGLFMGTALSISALPIIARILMDLGLHKTPLATVVMASATIDDLIGWCLLAAILSHAGAGATARSPWTTLALILAVSLFALTAGRRLAKGIRPWLRSKISEPGTLVCIVAVIGLVLAVTTEGIGLHALFGAFLAGLMLARDGGDEDPVYDVIQRFAIGVLAPFYFVWLGMRVDFVATLHPAAVAAVLGVACLGKVGGATLGARLGGLPVRESLAVGFCMNARGALEMVLASVALDSGLIDQGLFTTLVVMAMVTTLASAPLVSLLGLSRRGVFAPGAGRG